MIDLAYGLARPLLFRLPPEDAHETTLHLLERGIYPRAGAANPRLEVSAFGLTFANPLGIAAGFDKDARVIDPVLGLGCGFAEVGTLTPKPQSGNPRPRVFRLIEDRALINRLGFNNGGHAAALGRLGQRRRTGVLAINIGANKDSPDRIADYVAGLEAFAPFASFIVVNISSPNTPGLRGLQAPGELDDLLSRLMARRAALAATTDRLVPIVVKLAPDIAEDDLPLVVDRLQAHAVDGISVSNTTIARPAALRDRRQAGEGGGLSGRPLFERSTILLARIHQQTKGALPLIGIGGIDSPETAFAKIAAGATLIELYTGLLYEGPGLIGRILSGLARKVAAAGKVTIGELKGSQAEAWAAKPLPR